MLTQSQSYRDYCRFSISLSTRLSLIYKQITSLISLIVTNRTMINNDSSALHSLYNRLGETFHILRTLPY